MNRHEIRGSRQPIKITPPKKRLDWQPAMQIVILGNDLTFITKAGNGETEIVMTITSYDQAFAESKVFLVEQRNVVPLGRRLPERIYGRLQRAASPGGATPKVIVTQANDDRPTRKHQPKLP